MMLVQQLKRSILSQIPTLIITLSLMLLLPFFVHTIGGSTAGAHWLPLFYAPFVAAVLFHPSVSIIASVMTPFLNHFLLGMPPLSIAVILSVELIVFSVVAQQFSSRWNRFWAVAPVAYMIAKVVSLLLTVLIPALSPVAPWQYFSTAIMNAWPGLLVLLFINLLVVKGEQYVR